MQNITSQKHTEKKKKEDFTSKVTQARLAFTDIDMFETARKCVQLFVGINVDEYEHIITDDMQRLLAAFIVLPMSSYIKLGHGLTKEVADTPGWISGTDLAAHANISNRQPRPLIAKLKKVGLFVPDKNDKYKGILCPPLQQLKSLLRRSVDAYGNKFTFKLTLELNVKI